MGLTTGLYTGASGLAAHGDAISAVGDNIANVSTIGYKSAGVDFVDVMGGTAPTGGRLGAGVRLGGLNLKMEQGSFVATGGALDLAMAGSGYFVVKNSANEELYTRDGRMKLDSTGKLINGGGMAIQGYLIDTSGVVAVAHSDLILGASINAPKATSTLSMAGNLDSSSTVDPGGAAFVATSAATMATTSNFSTSTTIYDSLGNDHRVDLYYRRDSTGGANAWEWYAVIENSETGGAAGPVVKGAGTMTFSTAGALATEATTTPFTVTFTGAAAQTVATNFGDETAVAGNTGLLGFTQYQTSSVVSSVTQNGLAPGSLVELTVADDGTINAKYSNGQQGAVARLAIAKFSAETGLKRRGDSIFEYSTDSGRALVGTAKNGGRGSINSGNLEASNVDLGYELVSLIAYQRAYQANTKTISTSDDLLQEVTNLKR